MNFFRRAKKTDPSLTVKEISTPQNPVSERNNPVVQSRSNEPGPHVISKKDDIPVHDAVLSVAGGPIAVLLTRSQSKEVEIICTLEVAKRAGLDDEYMAIVDRLKRQDYKRVRSKLIASQEILQIIYEETEQKRSKEEKEKASTEIQKNFDELLLRAVNDGASDIHFEVRRDHAQIRFRINGDLGDPMPWAVRQANVMANVIYMVIAAEKETAFDPARPQSAIIDRDLGEGVRVRVRLNTLPAYSPGSSDTAGSSGFDMIMRLLKMGQSAGNINLNKLGYNKEQLIKTRRAVAKPTGAIIMSGTTGSGKSTSLNAMLTEKIAAHGGRIKVITVEDPPEYVLHGATQVPIVRSRSAAQSGDTKENPFAAAVSATMRSDPDIIMVGEVRDHVSAELLIHAVQSGHQVYTTIHAASGIDIIARLRSQGVPDDVLGSQNFVAALMYQALLPVVCPHCSTSVHEFSKNIKNDSDEEMLIRIYRHLGNNQAEAIKFRHHEGCPHCMKGVVGRTVASEIILPDAYMLKAFRDRQDMDAIMYHAYIGGKIALHHGIEKLIQGMVDIRDVEQRLDQISFLAEIQTSLRHYVRTSGIAEALGDKPKDETVESPSPIYVPDAELVISKTPEIMLPAGMEKEPSPQPIVLDKPVLANECAEPNVLTVTSAEAEVLQRLLEVIQAQTEVIETSMPVHSKAEEILPPTGLVEKFESDANEMNISEVPSEVVLAQEVLVDAIDVEPLAQLPAAELEPAIEISEAIGLQSTPEVVLTQENELPVVIDEIPKMTAPENSTDLDLILETSLEPMHHVEDRVQSPVTDLPPLHRVVECVEGDPDEVIQPLADTGALEPEISSIVESVAVELSIENKTDLGDGPQPDKAPSVQATTNESPAEEADQLTTEISGQDVGVVEEPVVEHDCEAAFLESLQEVLETEVARNGFALTARFMKGRLSEGAITALLGSELVPELQAMTLKDAFGALNAEERGRVFSFDIEQVQKFLDSRAAVKATALNAQQTKAVVVDTDTSYAPVKKPRRSSAVTPIESAPKAKPRAKAAATKASKASVLKAEGEVLVTPPEATGKPKYKSRLLAGEGGTASEPQKDNVKSLAAARAQKDKDKADSNEGAASAKPATKAPGKAATKPSTRKPPRSTKNDQVEE